MAYSISINPNLPKARALAMRMLVRDGLPLRIVANRCGVHRSTIYRWKTKWMTLNKDIRLENTNRQSRKLGSVFRFAALKWLIPTLSSRPKRSPNVAKVLSFIRS